MNYAGVIHAVCFDKTGTLTDDKLTFHSCWTVVQEGLQLVRIIQEKEEDTPLLCQLVMATCHGLSIISGSKAVGDLLEVELLHASRWTLRINGSFSGSTGNNNKLVASPPTANNKGLDSSDRIGKGSECDEYVIYKHFEFFVLLVLFFLWLLLTIGCTWSKDHQNEYCKCAILTPYQMIFKIICKL